MGPENQNLSLNSNLYADLLKRRYISRFVDSVVPLSYAYLIYIILQRYWPIGADVGMVYTLVAGTQTFIAFLISKNGRTFGNMATGILMVSPKTFKPKVPRSAFREVFYLLAIGNIFMNASYGYIFILPLMLIPMKKWGGTEMNHPILLGDMAFWTTSILIPAESKEEL